MFLSTITAIIMPPKPSVKRQKSHLEKDEEIKYALQVI
jgi:hypothetical protein